MRQKWKCPFSFFLTVNASRQRQQEKHSNDFNEIHFYLFFSFNFSEPKNRNWIAREKCQHNHRPVTEKIFSQWAFTFATPVPIPSKPCERKEIGESWENNRFHLFTCKATMVLDAVLCTHWYMSATEMPLKWMGCARTHPKSFLNNVKRKSYIARWKSSSGILVHTFAVSKFNSSFFLRMHRLLLRGLHSKSSAIINNCYFKI